MLKKTITYTDFDGNQRTEDHYFNLTQHELIEIAMELPNGLMDFVSKIPNVAQNEEALRAIGTTMGDKKLFGFVKNIILKSYGKKSLDGRRHEKSEEISKEFSETMAFDTLFMELMANSGAGAGEFIEQLVPKSTVDKMIAANNGQ